MFSKIKEWILGTIEIKSRKNLLIERKLLRGTEVGLESGLPGNLLLKGVLQSKIMRWDRCAMGKN